MWTIFKVIIEFVTILLLFYSLVFWPQGHKNHSLVFWDLNSPTRDQTHNPRTGGDVLTAGPPGSPQIPRFWITVQRTVSSDIPSLSTQLLIFLP